MRPPRRNYGARSMFCILNRPGSRRPGSEREEQLMRRTVLGSGGCGDRAGATSAGDGREGLRRDRAQHHSLGPVREPAGAAGCRHPGQDVRRPDAAVRPGHQRRPDDLLQVRALRRRHRDPEHDRGRAAGRRDDRARLLQRPARQRRHARRRRLGGRLDRRGGPRPAARAGALQRSRRRDRRPRPRRAQPDQRPAQLRAQRPDRGRGRQADRTCSRTPGPRARRSCTTSTSSSAGSTTTAPRRARASRRGRAPTSSR